MEQYSGPQLEVKQGVELGSRRSSWVELGSRRSSLNSYVQGLDREAVGDFLTHLQDAHVSKQYAIRSYEAIAREHGKIIIPHITGIMSNLVKVMSSEGPSSSLGSLQEACAKVVSALARYTIDPSLPAKQAQDAIRSLANPMLEVLLGNVQSVAEGAAICLQALVEAETWKAAPEDIVNEVCLRVTGALEERGTQTVAHMKLVCALAKRNSLILEAYGRSLLKATAEILDNGIWQLRLHAVQMINTLFKSVDSDILCSEIPNTVVNLERCRSDRMPSIRKEALETLKIARAIASEKGIDVSYDSDSDFAQDMGSYINSPVSSFRNLNARYQTPSTLDSVTGARSSYHMHGSRGYYSDSIDEGSQSGERRDLSFSMLSQMSNPMSTGYTPSSLLSHRRRESAPSEYFAQRSHFFDEEDDRNISLQNGIVSEDDREVHVECDGDEKPSGRRYSLGNLVGQRKTRLHMLGQRENADALTNRKDCLKKKHYYEEDSEKENAHFFSFHESAQSPHPLNVDEEDTKEPKKARCLMGTDSPNASSKQRTFGRSLQYHSCPKSTNRKIQSRTEFTGCADGTYDEVRGESNGRTAVAMKGRVLLDKLESVADGVSDRSNSQEGSLHNSSVWSESLQRSDSLSRTSHISDSEEDYLTTLPSEPDERTPFMDDTKKNCQSAQADSAESSVDSSELEETSAFWRGWTKVTSFLESILAGSLCAVLAFPATMVAVKLFSNREEYHVMLPT